MLSTRLEVLRKHRDVLAGISADYRAFRLSCACAAVRTALEATETAAALGGARQACAALGNADFRREYADAVGALGEFIRLRTLLEKLVARENAEKMAKRAAEALVTLNGVVRRAAERYTVEDVAQNTKNAQNGGRITDVHQGLLDVLLLDDDVLKAALRLSTFGRLGAVDASLALAFHAAVRDALARGSRAFYALLRRQPGTVVRLLFFLFGLVQNHADVRRTLLQLENLLCGLATTTETQILGFLRRLDDETVESLLPGAPPAMTQKILAYVRRVVADAEARLAAHGDAQTEKTLKGAFAGVSEADADAFLEAACAGPIRTTQNAIRATLTMKTATTATTMKTATTATALRIFADAARQVLAGQLSRPLRVRLDTHVDVTRYRFRLAETQTLGRLVGRLRVVARGLFGGENDENDENCEFGEFGEKLVAAADDALLRMLHATRFGTQTVVVDADPDAPLERRAAVNRLVEYAAEGLGVVALHAQHLHVLGLLERLKTNENGENTALSLQIASQRRRTHRTLRTTAATVLQRAASEPTLFPAVLGALRDFAADIAWQPLLGEKRLRRLQTSFGATVVEALIDVVIEVVNSEIPRASALLDVLGDAENSDFLVAETTSSKPSTAKNFLVDGAFRAHGNEYPAAFDEAFEASETSSAVVAAVALRRLETLRFLLRADVSETRSPAALAVWTPQDAIRLLRGRFGNGENAKDGEKGEKGENLSRTVRWLKAHGAAPVEVAHADRLYTRPGARGATMQNEDENVARVKGLRTSSFPSF